MPAVTHERNGVGRRPKGGVMVLREAIGQAEQQYLRAVYLLADCEAKTPVSFREIQKYLGLGDEEAERCCDFWTDKGVLEWSTLGHIALTHVGFARAEHIRKPGSPATQSAAGALMR